MKKLKTINVIKHIQHICDELDELDNYLDSLPELHSEMDLRMSDLYHPIENNKLTSTQAKRFTDELQSVCNNRRIIKQDLSYEKIFRDNINKLLQKDNRQILLTKLYSSQKQAEKTNYKYRIYSDTEINNLLGVKTIKKTEETSVQK